MSPFEELSSTIALANAIATRFGALATAGAVLVAWSQLRKLVAANSVGQLSALVALEEALQARRVRLAEAQGEVGMLVDRELQERSADRTGAADAFDLAPFRQTSPGWITGRCSMTLSRRTRPS